MEIWTLRCGRRGILVLDCQEAIKCGDKDSLQNGITILSTKYTMPQLPRSRSQYFSVPRIQFSGFNAERTDNKHIYTDKTPRVFSQFQLKNIQKSPFTHDKTNPQINMKFMQVIMQLWYLNIRHMRPASYSFRLALCSPKDAVWGTDFEDKEEIIHKVSAFRKQERNSTNW
jgi:hypothetical protein